MFLNSITLLTKSSTFIIGPLAEILGIIMDFIFNTLDSIGIYSLGWSIIIFTIFVRIILLPLFFKQQKSMQGMQKIQPEMKKIQDKYKNRKDKESQQQMQMEMSQLYQAHGVSPLGGCLPMLVQMPIIFALFQVLRNIPSYVMTVKGLYTNIAISLVTQDGANEFLTRMATEVKNTMVKDFSINNTDKVIDVLGHFTSVQWAEFTNKFSAIGDVINTNYTEILDIYTFLGVNLADKPDLMSIGILLPILNVGLQFLIMKTSSSSMGDNAQNKAMMYTMPLMTGFFVVTMPAGLGLYWLVGNIFQYGQQMIINKHLKESNN